jgi:hypothetical protein
MGPLTQDVQAPDGRLRGALKGQLSYYDAGAVDLLKLRVGRRPNCPACGRL